MTSSRRPRVLLVGPMPPTKGGITTFMLNLIDSPLKHEVEFQTFTVTRPPKKNVIRNWGYGAVLRGGLLRIAIGLWLTAYRILTFPLHLVFRRIDIVQLHASDYNVYWEAVAYCLLAHLFGRPVVFRIGGAFDLFHGNSSPRVQALIARSLLLPDIVIAQSDFARFYFERVGRIRNIVVIPNWTGVSIAPVQRPAALHPICMFSASNEAIRKGFEEVLEAMRILDASGSPARFHLLAMVPQLEARVRRLGLRNVLRIDGPVAHDAMLAAMRQSDIFLLPSHGEGFPNSLIEAMTAGLPCIVTPVAAVPEIVAEGGALVIDVGNGRMLADAIDRLARDAALRQELSAQAQATIRRRYTPQIVLPPLAAAYRGLLPQPIEAASELSA